MAAADLEVPPATMAGQDAYAELRELRATIYACRLALIGAPTSAAALAAVRALLDRAPATPPSDVTGVQLLVDVVCHARLERASDLPPVDFGLGDPWEGRNGSATYDEEASRG